MASSLADHREPRRAIISTSPEGREPRPDLTPRSALDWKKGGPGGFSRRSSSVMAGDCSNRDLATTFVVPTRATRVVPRATSAGAPAFSSTAMSACSDRRG